MKTYGKPYLLALLIISTAGGRVVHMNHPLYNDPWNAESLFVGAGLIAVDSAMDITVTLDGSKGTDGIGRAYFMVPGYPDSAVFLFHNLHDRFPEESTTVSIGKYRAGTQIVLMYQVVDTNTRWDTFRGERLYTGQNREGIDAYISERAPVRTFARCFAMAAKCADGTVEVGFSDGPSLAFWNIMLTITNAYLEVLEKNKIPYVHVSPAGDDSHSESVRVSLWVPDSGLLAIKDRDTISNPLADGEQLRIYYTLDGTDPRTSQSRELYEGEFQITRTCTLKAYAELTGETNWYPSEVTTRAFTVDASGLARHIGVPAGRLPERIQPGSQVTLLHASGRIVGRFSAVECRSLLAHSRLAPGVYFIKYRGRGGTHTRSFAVTAE